MINILRYLKELEIMKKISRCFIIFLCLFVIIFCYTYFFRNLFTDEIWCYGFGYNIASGLVPYRDFNMIVTPFYSFVVALFIIIFGHHLWVVHVINALIIIIMLFFMYKRIGNKVLILLPIVLFNCYPSYNFFSLFLLIILLYIIDSNIKNKELIISFIVSLIFLTKQTIGMALFIPMIYYSKNKLKSFIIFLIPIFIFLLYLLFNHALFNFIDYCFLGMFEFTSKNKLMIFLPFEIIILIVLIYKNFKCHFKDKQLFFILAFQIMVFPIVDLNHFGINFILISYYFISKFNINKKYIKYCFIILTFSFAFWDFCQNFYYSDYHFYSDKSSYLYGRHMQKYVQNSITIISDYMEDVKNDYDSIYLLTANAYEIKMNTSYKINKFDLINNGNMGYNGSIKYIKEIENNCDNNSCLFILYKYDVPKNPKYIQINTDILNYVSSNYQKEEEIDVFDIYVS